MLFRDRGQIGSPPFERVQFGQRREIWHNRPADPGDDSCEPYFKGSPILKRHRRHRGFIVIFGWRVLSTRERTAAIQARCPNCNVEDARLVGKMRRTWFTLFFIPVFPIDRREQVQRVSQCRECKKTFDMPIEQLARRASAGGRSSLADTFPVYNALRERPADGKTMLKLLKMYAQLDELTEAEAAARHFPQAMAADPACGQLLDGIRRGTQKEW